MLNASLRRELCKEEINRFFRFFRLMWIQTWRRSWRNVLHSKRLGAVGDGRFSLSCQTIEFLDSFANCFRCIFHHFVDACVDHIASIKPHLNCAWRRYVFLSFILQFLFLDVLLAWSTSVVAAVAAIDAVVFDYKSVSVESACLSNNVNSIFNSLIFQMANVECITSCD